MKHLCISLLLIAAMLCGVVAASSCKTPSNDPEPFNYIKEDLSPYVEVDTDAYRGATVELKYDVVTEWDVDDWINRILFSHRASMPENGGAGETDVPITLGDELYVFYRGYLLGEDGTREYFTGGSNVSGTSAKVSIGEMGYMSGFEDCFIGLVPAEMTTMKNSGRITEGDYITISYFVLYPDHTYERTSATFLFSPEERATIDARFGEGFYDILASEENALEYGASNEKAYISSAQLPYSSDEHGTGTISYQDVLFQYGTSAEEPATVATVYFPASYTTNTALACQTAYFEMYLDAAKAYVVQYEVPEFNDAFILEQDELSMDDLLTYEGETLTEKYRAAVRDLLEGSELAGKMEYETLLFDTYLDVLLSSVTVLSYPERAMLDIIEPLREELDYAFTEIAPTYGYTDRETFAAAYFGYSSGTSEAYFEKTAKETVGQRLAFYQIAKLEGALPSEEALAARVEELKQEYLAINIEQNADEFDPSSFETPEAYQAAVDAYYEEMIAYYVETYGEDYFLEEARYTMVMTALTENVEIRILGRTDPVR